MDRDLLDSGIDELRESLSEFPFIRIHPDHFTHIMIQELGFLTEQPDSRDEVSLARLEEFTQAASNAFRSSKPFRAVIGGVNAFRDSIFLDVHDGGGLSRLHARLRELAAVTLTPRYAYLPHVTIAHFTEQVALGSLRGVLVPWRDFRFAEIEIDRIEIVTMDISEAYPELVTFATLSLGSDLEVGQ
jgi:RNA 2',3'-cyclic 3'-phosphodiesterase